MHPLWEGGLPIYVNMVLLPREVTKTPKYRQSSDCYSGNGTNFRGKHSQTPIGECATWTEDNLKQFPSAENKVSL